MPRRKFSPFDIELPSSTSQSVRMEWAGERYADLVEGIIDDETGRFIWGLIVGWGDLGTAHEREACIRMASIFEDHLRNKGDG